MLESVVSFLSSLTDSAASMLCNSAVAMLLDGLQPPPSPSPKKANAEMTSKDAVAIACLLLRIL